ncbi:MAG: hypothetical protein ABR614_07190 [Mycobacteriales bacterium]
MYDRPHALARTLATAVLALIATALLPVAAAHAEAAPAGATGHDVSYPQCGKALPTAGSFGIVGVTNGIAFSANPCLAEQWQWASSQSYAPALYTTPANPGPASSRYRPTSGSSDPALCKDATSNTDPGCAYDYGWHAATDALSTALAGAPGAATVPWWLDVETANTYNGDGISNAAALQGMIDYLRGQGVPSVGFYSTAAQWNSITGGWTTSTDGSYRAGWADEFTPAYAMSDSPTWVAGSGSLSDAQARCGTGFAGTPTVLAQYLDGNVDGDVVCASAPAHEVPTIDVQPYVVTYGQVATVTISGTPGALVDLYARKYQADFVKIRDGLVLDASGRVAVTTRPDMNLRFQARDRTVAEGSSLAGANGLMTVQKYVSVGARREGVRRFTFTGSINPLHPGATVSLFRNGAVLRSGIPVNASRVYSFTGTFPAGTATFQVRTGSTGYNAASASPPRSVRIY